MAELSDAQAVGARVESLLADIEQLAQPMVRDKTEELVRTVVEFYGSGLERMVELVRASDEQSGGDLIKQFTADGLLASLLILHDLHPAGTEERVLAALEKVRPYLGSHAGDVEYLGLDEAGVVRLRLAGSCNGCPSSTVTVKLAIEQAIHDAAPEVTDIQVEGVAEPPEPKGRKLLPLQQVPHAADRPADRPATDLSAAVEARWVELDQHAAPAAGSSAATDIGGLAVLVCNVDGQLYAYADRCAGCGNSLSGGAVLDGVLCCPACAQHFNVTVAGIGTDDPALHLDALPLLANGTGTRIALPRTEAVS